MEVRIPRHGVSPGHRKNLPDWIHIRELTETPENPRKELNNPEILSDLSAKTIAKLTVDNVKQLNSPMALDS
jgi:hypothetical protein